jgi:hypothetical protein
MATTSSGAIWSFTGETAVTEVVSQLEGAGIRCSFLSTHDNLATHTWLLVSGEQNRAAREMIKSLPAGLLKDSVEIVSVLQEDIPTYAAHFGKRYRHKWVLWLIIFLWPLGFGLRFWWVLISLLALLGIVVLILKTTLSCPCCRKPIVSAVKFGNSVGCSYCGIKSQQGNA